MRVLIMLAAVFIMFSIAVLALQVGWNAAAPALGIGTLNFREAFGVAIGIGAVSWLTAATRPAYGGPGA